MIYCSYRPLLVSLSCKAKHIDNYVVVLEWILLAKVSIVFGIPEATRAHVETAITLLQDDHISSELEVLIDFLEQLDDDFTGVVAPFLRLLRVINL